MTEHSAQHVTRSAHRFSIGQSSLSWEDDTLTITIDEKGCPIPRRIRGTVKVRTTGLAEHAFFIDNDRRHRWRPLSPISRIELDLDQPDLRWSGYGYLDTNDGDEPLEDAFTFWDWSRTVLDQNRTAILYNTDMASGPGRLSALVVNRYGEIEEFQSPAPAALPRTPIFRIPRRTRSEAGGDARVVKTLEDTPFYSRSIVDTTLFGAKRRAIHESLSGPRLKHPLVKFMLPYRMPRVE